MDDYDSLAVLPIEVKSGRDYRIHSAINRFVSNADYPVNEGIVLCNDREVTVAGKITHLPIYYSLFMKPDRSDEDNILL